MDHESLLQVSIFASSIILYISIKSGFSINHFSTPNKWSIMIFELKALVIHKKAMNLIWLLQGLSCKQCPLVFYMGHI